MKKLMILAICGLAAVSVTFAGVCGPDGNGTETGSGKTAQSCDPNEISGPLGMGEKRYVKQGEWMSYTIYFENKTNATAAAQEVFVDLPMDENLDWTTLELGEIAFGEHLDTSLVAESPAKKARLQASYAMPGTNTFVKTEVKMKDGVLSWYMRDWDPTTADNFPASATGGFLPPNDPETHCGEGHLSYRVRVKSEAPNGAVIRASAQIVFDQNPMIETDPSWWNTVATFHDVSIEIDGVTTNLTLIAGEPFGELPTPAVMRTGYTFDAWYTGENGAGLKASPDAIVPEGEFSLYANWVENTYTVRFNANGGKGEMADQLFTYDHVSCLSSNAFTYARHVFCGWATNETGEVAYEDGAEVLNLSATADAVIDLYAVWTDGVPVAEFSAAAAAGEEGGNIVVRVSGGNAENASRVDVYLTYNTATAADVDLAKGNIDGAMPKGGLKFPLTLSWAKGEVGEKVITIPVKADKTVEGDEFFTLQLANAQGMELGEERVCTVTIRDQNDKTLKAAVAAYKPKKGEAVATNSVTVVSGDAKGGFVAGTGEYTSGSKLSLTAEARPGWAFKGWRLKNGNGTVLSDKAKWQVAVTNDAEYEAVFEQIPYVRGLADPADGGKVTGSGLCDKGKKVTLKATANKNFTFLGWTTNQVDGAIVATTASLVIDRTAKPAANSKTSTTITGIDGDVTYYAVFKSYPEVFVTVDATDGKGANPTGNGAGKYVAGTITGMGKYAIGKTKIALKATANKGYVFSGWYDAVGKLLTKDATYTIAAMGEGDVEYTAKFITSGEDKGSITLEVDGVGMGAAVSSKPPYQTNVWAGVYLEWPVAASALSATTVKVTGLPPGLKFTAKPVTSKVGTGKAAVVVTNVPANTVYGAPTAASKADRNGKVTPSKVVFTVTTAGKSSQTYQIDMVVEALPAWASGKFDGGSGSGQAQLTVAANGKLSGKYMEGGVAYTLAAGSYSSYADGSYFADVTASWSYKDGKATVKASDVWTLAVGEGAVGGVVESDRFDAWQNLWSQKEWKDLGTQFFGKNGTTMTLSGEAYGLGEGETVELSIKANGTVTAKGVFGKVSASGSAVVCAESVEPFRGKVFVYFAPNPAKGFAGYVRVVDVGDPDGQ